MGQRVFDNLPQAAAALNLDPALLKVAKAKGCDAFSHGRVYEERLLPWLEIHAEALKQAAAAPTDWEGVRIANGLEQLRERRRDNDVADKVLVRREWVIGCMAKASGRMQAERARIESEGPRDMAAAGDDMARQRVVLSAILDRFMVALQGMAEEFREGPPA